MGEVLHWYAVYTKPRFEKKLTFRLNEKGIEAYTPLRKTLKQWSDRKKMVEEPLISSYVFVNIHLSQYYEVLNTPGAVMYIWFNGKPASIPSSQIDTLKRLVDSDAEIEVTNADLPKGSQVRISEGALKGLTGELIHLAGKKKVVIRIDEIEKTLLVTISPKLLEIVRSNRVTE
jgi:transcription antitermination factor NusG